MTKQLDIRTMTPEDLEIVRQCLRAAVEGPFFPDWEFPILFGVERNEVNTVYEAWPEQAIDTEDFYAAVVGAMNHLLGYPHGEHGEGGAWSQYISASPERVMEILRDLTALDR